MKVAVLISGRSTGYERCILPLLEKTKYDVDLFMSINDDDCKYYDVMKEKLRSWIRDISIKRYEPPSDFFNNHPETLLQEVRGKKYPHNVLSCFYNDKNAFDMAVEYQNNNQKYDVFLKFRSDIIVSEFPDFSIVNQEERLFSAHHRDICHMKAPLFDKSFLRYTGEQATWVSDAVSFGNQKSMEKYVKTYEFILYVNSALSGNYRINFEPCLTESVYSENVLVTYLDYAYDMLSYEERRKFDIDVCELTKHRINCDKIDKTKIESFDL